VKHPFEGVPTGRRRTVMLALVIATTPVMAALALLDRTLPCGIVDFELCAFRGACDRVIVAYRPAGLEVGMSIGLDYLFMPLYAATLAAAVVFVAARRGERARWAAGLIAWGATGAAGFDAVENAAMYHMVETGTAAAGWLASGAAANKFALVAIAIVALPVIVTCAKARPSARSA
jgi:hypothetical protein